MARNKVRLIRNRAPEILSSDEVGQFLDALMARVEAQAKATAPTRSGAHARSIQRGLIQRGDRKVAQLYASASHSAGVEARTGHMAAALDAAG